MKNTPRSTRQEKDEASPEVVEDVLFIAIKQFRKHFTEILNTTREGKTVVLFSKKKPQALVRSELPEEGLQQLDEVILSKGPLKYLKAASQGERFELVDDSETDGDQQVILQEATEGEWVETLLRELEERHRACARKHSQDRRAADPKAARERDRAAYAANPASRAKARERSRARRAADPEAARASVRACRQRKREKEQKNQERN